MNSAKETCFVHVYTHADQRKLAARNAASKAKREGALVVKPCIVCTSENNVCMHHEDYDNHLAITWLCRKCHVLLHRKRGDLGKQTHNPYRNLFTITDLKRMNGERSLQPGTG